MTDHYDGLETREPARREGGTVRKAPGRAAQGHGCAQAYAERLKGIDPASVD